MRVAVLASGRGSNLEALLHRTASGTVQAEVVQVVSDRDGARCLRVARRGGVADVRVVGRREGERAAGYDERLRDTVAGCRPDLVVLAGFMRILGPRFLSRFGPRIVNIHPSLLPAFPGAHGIRDALRAGARIAGCTTHVVTADLDGGPILLQAALAVRHGEDREALATRVQELEHLILPRTVQLFAEGRVHLDGHGARVAPGPSWLGDPRIQVPGDALWGEGF